MTSGAIAIGETAAVTVADEAVSGAMTDEVGQRRQTVATEVVVVVKVIQLAVVSQCSLLLRMLARRLTVARAGTVVPAEAGTPVPAKAGTPVPVAKAGTPAPAADDVYDEEEEEEEEESDQTIDVPVVPLATAPLPGPGQVPGPATETGKPAGGAAPGSSTLTAQVSRRSSPPEPANPPKPKVAAPADKTKSTVFDCAVCGRRVGGGQAGLSQHRRSAHHLACWVYWSQG